MAAPTQTYVYKVTGIKEVHDGDTVRVVIDQGLGDSREFWGRVKGIDTYELNDPNGKGKTAREYLDLILHAAKEVMIETFRTKSKTPNDLMTFGRYVADIWVDGYLVADLLRENGYAKPLEHLG